MPITVVQGDLTAFRADVLANAANAELAGGGGVDGALHRAAGPGLLAECRGLGGCAPGDAKLTAAYDLPARWVAHCVGPVWRGGDAGEAELLARTHRRALELAHAVGARSLAFPAISCGVYGYPIEQAARVATAAVSAWLRAHDDALDVTFVCFGDETRRAFEAARRALEAA